MACFAFFCSAFSSLSFSSSLRNPFLFLISYKIFLLIFPSMFGSNLSSSINEAVAILAYCLNFRFMAFCSISASFTFPSGDSRTSSASFRKWSFPEMFSINSSLCFFLYFSTCSSMVPPASCTASLYDSSVNPSSLSALIHSFFVGKTFPFFSISSPYILWLPSFLSKASTFPGRVFSSKSIMACPWSFSMKCLSAFSFASSLTSSSHFFMFSFSVCV